MACPPSCMPSVPHAMCCAVVGSTPAAAPSPCVIAVRLVASAAFALSRFSARWAPCTCAWRARTVEDIAMPTEPPSLRSRLNRPVAWPICSGLRPANATAVNGTKMNPSPNPCISRGTVTYRKSTPW